MLRLSLPFSPRGLTSWWGCYGLCFWHKTTELALPFSVLVSVSVSWPFNCISFHKFSWQLSVFSLCSSGLLYMLRLLPGISSYFYPSGPFTCIFCSQLHPFPYTPHCLPDFQISKNPLSLVSSFGENTHNLNEVREATVMKTSVTVVLPVVSHLRLLSLLVT